MTATTLEDVCFNNVDSRLYHIPTALPLTLGPFELIEEASWLIADQRSGNVVEGGTDFLSAFALALTLYRDWHSSVIGGTYFIGAPNALQDGGLIKIGRSIDIVTRVKGLTNSSAEPVEMLAFVEGDGSYESVAHDRFRKKRRHGEWFAVDFELFNTVLSHRMENFTEPLRAEKAGMRWRHDLDGQYETL
jgi:hypothetical protein